MCFPYWTTGKYINILFHKRMMLVNRSIFKSIRCFNLILAWSTVITLSDPWSSSSWLLESEDDGFAVLAFWILRHLLNKIYFAKFHCDCAKFHLNCANFHWRFHGFYQTTILPTFIEIVPFLIINVPLYNLFLCLKCQLGPPSVTKNHHFQSFGTPLWGSGWWTTIDRWQVKSNPSWVPEARSKTLRTPQNVPAWL